MIIISLWLIKISFRQLQKQEKLRWQESITKDTEVISGKVLCKGSMEVLIQVKLNKMVIAEKVMTKDEDSFSIETDF